MAIQMIVTLTEEEHAALRAKAAGSGKQPETVLHEIMRQGLGLSPQEQRSSEEHRPLTDREFAEKLYREGKLSHLATLEPSPPEEEEAEWERFIQSLAGRPGKPLSEIVIEDRGPY